MKNIHIRPTSDYVFKSIFGQVGNEKITQKFLSTIIGKKITSISLDENTMLDKNVLSDKLGILDIKATLNSSVICDIEMQMQNHENFEERMLYYWSKLYSKTLNKSKKKGKKKYEDLKKTISIQILDFEPTNLKSLNKFHSKWKIIETECSNLVLTDHLEFHIISLEKLKNILRENNNPIEERKLINWIKFLLTPDNLDPQILKEEEEIKMAKKELDRFRSNECEVYIAELREKAILDEENLKYTAYKRGKREGKTEGINIGKRENKIKIAKKMLQSNMKIEDIMYLTELTKEEIQKLIKKSNT